MIDTTTISLNYIKKDQLTGSYKGMRYRLAKVNDEIEVIIWPEPFNFFTTSEDKKQKKMFSLNNEGKEEAVEWLNNQYTDQRSLWDLAMHTPQI